MNNISAEVFEINDFNLDLNIHNYIGAEATAYISALNGLNNQGQIQPFSANFIGTSLNLNTATGQNLNQ